MKFYEYGAALAPDMGVPVSKMWESIEAHIQASSKTVQDLVGEPFPAYPCGKWQDGFRTEVLPCRGYGSACLEDGRINRSPYSRFLENCPGSQWSRSQRILAASLGTKLPARWAQGRSSTTTPFRKPISLSAETNGLCTEASYSYTGTKGTLQGFELHCEQRPRKCHGTQRCVHRRRANSDVGSGTATRVYRH